MRVLTVVNQREAGPGAFAAAAAAEGAELVEWAIAERPAPGGRLDAALVLGGAAHLDQDHEHDWRSGTATARGAFSSTPR